VNFALFSAKYNETATGRERVPITERTADLVSNLPGWPLCCTLAGSAIVLASIRMKRLSGAGRSPERDTTARDFMRMAWLGGGIAAAPLLFTSYFDPRFLLPIWPVFAVAIGTCLSLRMPLASAVTRSLCGAGLAASVVCAMVAVAREPIFPTYWKTTALIDDLVRNRGVSNLLNVGNCAGWNVCKTGLMNELRDDPGNCFVLHDLTKLSEPRARQLLKQGDGVIVLGRADLTDAVLQVAPGLNRGYGQLIESLHENPDFVEVPMAASQGLPELSVFVRSDRVARPLELLKLETHRRR
jgi:hypothetical protein